MMLKNQRELAHSRETLRELEERLHARQAETPTNRHVHELTLRSLKRLINQVKEEIARFEARETSAPRV